MIPKLKPLNPYGRSKNDFDIWVLEQANKKVNVSRQVAKDAKEKQIKTLRSLRLCEKIFSSDPTIHLSPPFWAGLKLFNVYGPNEYHKGRMASVIFHTFNQISETGKMNLFRSHNPQFRDGEQKRDFIYVKDVLAVCMFLMHDKVNFSRQAAKDAKEKQRKTLRSLPRVLGEKAISPHSPPDPDYL
ncbi:MAG: NAD-dependent epimerase/dehydratase family protein [Bacteroidetes bacterium]|nr:NAD-dependent epimerase/dehydratase family protein [Bacteroidota bacterium]